MRDSVPSGSYSSVCNVLRQWKSRSSLLIESTDSMIESTDSMILLAGTLGKSPVLGRVIVSPPSSRECRGSVSKLHAHFTFDHAPPHASQGHSTS